MLPTISRWTRLEPEGGAETCAVVEAPALLDLPRAGGFRDVLLTGRVADAGARGQRGSLVPNGLGGSGIVHPDPIPEADFTADSEDKKVKRLEVAVSLCCSASGHDRHWIFLNDHNVHAFKHYGERP